MTPSENDPLLLMILTIRALPGLETPPHGPMPTPIMKGRRMLERFVKALGTLIVGGAAASCAVGAEGAAYAAPPEVRGVWLTTTANDHIGSPARTAETMDRLSEIGLNTVYVEAWKNGYTQFPSQTLKQVIGVERRPDLIKQDPGDPDGPLVARDLLGEAVIEAHRHGLMIVGWFEYGFMAAHKDTRNHLREMYPHWLSRDIDGNEVAPNGFVWMNPLHPQTRRLLLDLILEAVDRYDLDGVQLDDRIVWPYYTMGYDDFTVAWYRNEHDGAAPPSNPRDPEWMRWRADKVNEYARQFVAELREKRPGLIVSLSPAPYPWCWENYLLEWPKWAAWEPGNSAGTWWDEFIPQCYRYDWPAFKATWDQQVDELRAAGAGDRVGDMLAGVLTTGSRPDPVPWADLRQEIDYVRETGGGGHVWWFSRGVLDEYPDEIARYYNVPANGPASHPKRPAGWRPGSVVLRRGAGGAWGVGDLDPGRYRVIARSSPDAAWDEVSVVDHPGGPLAIDPGVAWDEAELLVDRRPEMERYPPIP
jgi:uncharacterized lipoprotein YddW (UPF0748 family)